MSTPASPLDKPTPVPPRKPVSGPLDLFTGFVATLAFLAFLMTIIVVVGQFYGKSFLGFTYLDAFFFFLILPAGALLSWMLVRIELGFKRWSPEKANDEALSHAGRVVMGPFLVVALFLEAA